MSEVALLADYETVLAFRGVGVETVVCEEADQVAALIRELAGRGVKIILLTEAYAREAQDEIFRAMTRHEVSILSIPAISGSTGYGMEMVRRMSIRALGADVLFAEREGRS